MTAYMSYHTHAYIHTYIKHKLLGYIMADRPPKQCSSSRFLLDRGRAPSLRYRFRFPDRYWLALDDGEGWTSTSTVAIPTQGPSGGPHCTAPMAGLRENRQEQGLKRGVSPGGPEYENSVIRDEKRVQRVVFVPDVQYVCISV